MGMGVPGTPGADAVRVQVIRDSFLDLAHVFHYTYMAPDRLRTLYINTISVILAA
jgi:hypothetical protein